MAQLSSDKEATRAAPPDSEGLQYVKPEQNDKYPGVQRSSFESPEAIRELSQSDYSPHMGSDHSPQQGFYREETPFAAGPPKYHSTQDQSANQELKEGGPVGHVKRRKVCGIPLWGFIAIVAAVVVAAVVGGAVGGVVGSRHSSNKGASNTTPSSATTSTSSPTSTSSTTSATATSTANVVTDQPLPKAYKDSAMATLNPPLSDTLVLYYQMENGTIVEASFPLADFNSTTSNVTEYNTTTITSNTDLGTPLTVVSWTDQVSGQYIRQLFYTKNGYLHQISRIGDNMTWTAPVQISTDTVAAGSPALCAVAEPFVMQGVRLYYASSAGYIQELGYSINQNKWTRWYSFEGSDPASGVACSVQIGNAESWVNVYMRNATTGMMQQLWWGYGNADLDDEWTTSAANTSQVSPGSNVFAQYDGLGTDYIFYRAPTSSMERAEATPHPPAGTQFKGFNALAGAPVSNAVAAWYIADTGPVAIFQGPSEEGQGMYAANYAFNGALVFNKTLVG